MSPAKTGSPGSAQPAASVSKSSVTCASVALPVAKFHSRTYQARGFPAASRPSIVSVGPLTASSGMTPSDCQRKLSVQPR